MYNCINRETVLASLDNNRLFSIMCKDLFGTVDADKLVPLIKKALIFSCLK